MSALWAGNDSRHDPDLEWDEDWGSVEEGTDRSRPGGRRSLLRSVSLPQQRMARVPFVLVLIAIFGIGMAGLLMLNTTLQNQAFQSQQLNLQATQLTYDQAALTRKLDQDQAPQHLAARASELGMRANPNPGFVRITDGKISGYPKAVSGDEAPHQIVKTDAELQAQAIAARQAAAKKAAEEAAAKQAAADKAAADKKAADKGRRQEGRRQEGRRQEGRRQEGRRQDGVELEADERQDEWTELNRWPPTPASRLRSTRPPVAGRRVHRRRKSVRRPAPPVKPPPRPVVSPLPHHVVRALPHHVLRALPHHVLRRAGVRLGPKADLRPVVAVRPDVVPPCGSRSDPGPAGCGSA